MKASDCNVIQQDIPYFVIHSGVTNNYVFDFILDTFLKRDILVDIYFDNINQLSQYIILQVEAINNRIVPGIADCVAEATGIASGAKNAPHFKVNSAYNNKTSLILASLSPWCALYNTTTKYHRLAARLRITNTMIFATWGVDKNFEF